MKKASAKRQGDSLRPEYDLSRTMGGVRGKYYRQAIAGTNLVLIEPELADVFPNTEAVNRAVKTRTLGSAPLGFGTIWTRS